MLSTLRGFVRNRQSKWLAKRFAASDSGTSTARTVFILPTRQGIYLALALLAMLLACINYSLSLAYAVVFLVFSLALGAMHRTHQNLLGLEWKVSLSPDETGEVPLLWAGDRHTAPLLLSLSHTRRVDKWGIAVMFSESNLGSEQSLTHLTHLTHLTQSPKNLSLPIPAAQRGALLVPRITLSTTYPLGLWRAWSYVYAELPQPAWVFAAPVSPMIEAIAESEQREPLSPEHAARSAVQSTSSAQDLSHIQSLPEHSAIATRSRYWPALARDIDAEKVFEAEAEPSPVPSPRVWFKLAEALKTAPTDPTAPIAPTTPLELTLSRLAASIELAHVQGWEYGLDLGQRTIAIAQGAAHRLACHKALAQYGLSEPAVTRQKAKK